MEALFLRFCNLSITASWLILAILAVRLIFRKAPKWIFCLLWGLAALRLVCPVSIESMLSLIPSAEPLPQEIIYTAKPQVHSGVDLIDAAVNPILSASLTPAPGASANPTQIWSALLANLWILGMAVMALYAFVSWLLLRRKVATATRLEKNIKQSEFVDTPFVLGVFKPTIYLPYRMDPKDVPYVIAHEQAHIARHDHWWKPIGFLILCVYWFNPLLWVAYALLCRDIEAACDEKVIGKMAQDDLRAYSMALLNSSIRHRRITACPLAFGEVNVKDRIKNVMCYKKPAFWIVISAVVIAVVLAVCFLTVPEQPAPIDEDPHSISNIGGAEEPENIHIFITDITTQLDAHGITYTKQYSTDEFLDGAAVLLQISERDLITVYLCENERQLSANTEKAVYSTTLVEWVSIPHWYKDGNRLVLYLGVNQEILDIMERLYGKPFAGQGSAPDKMQIQSIEDRTITEQIDTTDAMELFFSDDDYHYFFPSVRSDHIIVTFADGREKPVMDALADGEVTIADLDAFAISYWKQPISHYDGTSPRVIDSASFDIDRDGTKEDCYLLYGPTSGLFTFELFVKENGEAEYLTIFNTEFYHLSFAEQNGALKVQGITQGEDPQTYLFDIVITDGLLQLFHNGEPLPTW